MLERVASCVEPRLWSSRTARTGVYRTSRLLHSQFWSNAAPEADLAQCLFAGPRERSAAYNKSQRQAEGSKAAKRAESPLLDFLYPAPAVALVQKLAAAEGRRRRGNGHRLYSSESAPLHSRRSKIQVPGDPGKTPPTSSKEGTGSNVSQRGGDHKTITPIDWLKESGADVLSGSDTLYEQSLEDAARTASLDRTGLGRVQALYNYGPDAVKTSIRVKQNIIIWLDQLQHLTEAKAWQWKLLDDMPSEDQLAQHLWRAAYCRIAVAHSLRNKKMQRAFAIVDGARAHQMQGDYGGARLLRTLVDQRKWLHAARLVDEMIASYERGVQARELFRLFTPTDARIALESLLHAFRHQTDAVKTKVSNLLANLMARYVSSLRQTAHAADFQKRSAEVTKLLESIPQALPGIQAVYELAIKRLCTVDPRDIPAYTRLMARAWTLYSQLPGYKPSRSLTTELLEAWKSGKLLPSLEASSRRIAFRPDIIEDVTSQDEREYYLEVQAQLIEIYANRADVAKVETHVRHYIDALGAQQPDANVLWPLIQVHAIRRDSGAAQNSFARISADFGVTPNTKCWDMLQYAFMQTDDLPGAVRVFEDRLDSGPPLTPQALVFLMTIYSRRGDYDAITSLLNLADNHNVRQTTRMRSTLLLAHANAGQLQDAEGVLDSTIKDHEAGTVAGSLTRIFNSAMDVHARRHEYMKFHKIYERMRKLEVPLDEQSYTCIINAFVMRRNTYEAWWTLDKVMPQANLNPTAFQYALVMTGYIDAGAYDEALRTWRHMQNRGIEPTISARAVYFKAKALSERQRLRAGSHSDKTDATARSSSLQGRSLEETTRELLEVLREPRLHGRSKEFGMRNYGPDDIESSMVEHLIYLHGKQQCFDVAWQLFQAYHDRQKSLAANQGKTEGEDEDRAAAPAFRLTTAMMSVYANAGEHEAVINCWNILYEQANILAKVQYPSVQSDPLALDLGMSAQSSKIAPSRRFLLSMPFRFYAASVLKSSETSAKDVNSLIQLLMALKSAGWQFDNITWNQLIQRLCTMSPSRALFAYTLTERYLIDSFPGWAYPRQVLNNTFGTPNKSRIATQTQYMNYPKRFVAPGERLPWYSTMVHLASALLELRKIESAGLRNDSKELRAQVGSVREVTQRCPRTLEQVQNLPVVLDKLQSRLIRKGDDFSDTDRWYGQA